MAVLPLVLGGVMGILCLCSVLLRWNEVRYRRKGLPPGTMGWPVFGETTEFLKQGPSFMRNQRARYGSLFKTHILGCPTVVSMDPDVNRYVLTNEGKGLVPGYPQSMLDILGKWNIAAVHGSLHKAIRGVLMSLIGPPAIREQILTKVDALTRSYLSNWGGSTIDVQEKAKEMAFLSSLKLVTGLGTGQLSEAIKQEFFKLVLGTLSLPIDLPGTNYRGGLQARKKIISLLREIIEERRNSASTHDDMLSTLLRSEDKSRTELTDDQLIDLIITIIYSGYETVSTTAMMAVKYLHDHPSALQEIREEHLAIRKLKSPEDPIDWNEYKSMSFTRSVIYETLRLATVVNGVLRRTTDDMEINGFSIPKGWKIYVYIRETNYDPIQYMEPLNFDPWRWKDKSLESHHYFTMFGGGSRLCPGKELGVVQVTMFLHYFLTKYRWEEVGGDELVQFPRVEAPKGLHFRVWDN
ncbi:hypothetical protein Taro_051299 [Colocasia esculenta]|uniref:Cytochrome P450 85A1 n=1 Tax=Colocasia esculenta TaxID=4460 RepID=A0A843XGG4_COLES|nr:hypothetical protein [Colocasia esculenta]